MVKKTENTIPPIYFGALSMAVVLYPLALTPMSLRIPCILGFLSLVGVSVCHVMLSVPSSTTYHSKRVFCLLCAFFGFFLASLCVWRIHLEKAALKSLAEQDRVTVLRGTLLSDPIPYGSDLYRVRMSVASCVYSNNSEFSSQGLCYVCIPTKTVRELLPGGIHTGNIHRIVFAEGLVVAMSGRFVAPSLAGDTVFMADSLGGTRSRWITPVHEFRASLRLSLMRILYDWGESGGFLLALLSANRDYLSPTLADEFRVTGLSHILALSGMHLSLIALVMLKTGKRFGGRRFSIKLALFAILFFVWFAGASPSLNRALIMSVLLMGARAIGFRPQILPVLAATFMLQTLISPSDSLSLAFLLSYGALWGILTFGEAFTGILSRYIPNVFLSSFSASIGAQLMTTPIVALTIGMLAPVGIIVSCIVSPLASIYLVVGIVLVFITILFPFFSHGCALTLDFLYHCTVFPVHMFASVPPLPIQGLKGTIIACILPLLAGLLLMYCSVICMERRSPDACFARL